MGVGFDYNIFSISAMWGNRIDNTPEYLSLLVKRVRADRAVPVDQLSSSFTLGDAIQLEWIISGGTTLEICPGVCHQRGVAADRLEPGK